MFKINNFLNYVCNSYLYFCFSITLLVFGVFLIVNFSINILSFEDNDNNQKTTHLVSPFNAYQGFSTNTIRDKKNQSVKKLKNLNDFDLAKISLNSESQVLDLQIPQNTLPLIKNAKTKKEKFIFAILPLIIQENNKIFADRNKLLEIKDSLIINKTLNKKRQKFIEKLAAKYNINTKNKHKIDIIDNLLESVDVIPNSIVIAQAANESGWGTSRFATDYNALFGEYTFDIKSGVVPIYRSEGDKYLIKFFSTVNESVESYFINLNTHAAYKDFRKKRKHLRKNNLDLDPINLAQHLTKYAKDKNYVKTIKAIIKINQLIQFDSIDNISTNS